MNKIKLQRQMVPEGGLGLGGKDGHHLEDGRYLRATVCGSI